MKLIVYIKPRFDILIDTSFSFLFSFTSFLSSFFFSFLHLLASSPLHLTSFFRFSFIDLFSHYVGLQNSAGRFLSKGNHLTSKKGKVFYAAGSRITRYNPSPSSADRLDILGPTTAPLRVVVS